MVTITAAIRRVLNNSSGIRLPAPGPLARSSFSKGVSPQLRSDKTPDLAESIAARIVALDPHAPHHRRRVLRILVEASLLNELGEALINAPRFQNIVELVVDALESSPLMSQDISTVLSQLSTAAPESSGSQAQG